MLNLFVCVPVLIVQFSTTTELCVCCTNRSTGEWTTGTLSAAFISLNCVVVDNFVGLRCKWSRNFGKSANDNV